MNKKLKIYLDTSVINFLFADDAPQFKEITIDFFENYLEDYDVFISEFVLVEINRTKNAEKRITLLKILNNYNLIPYQPANEEIFRLAQVYIKNGIIPPNKIDDALHLAFSTYFEFDILLSWNFKHLANINKQMKINSVNLLEGYGKQLLLHNPMEVIYGK
jgi:predicted nucleic acid-binding protein